MAKIAIISGSGFDPENILKGFKQEIIKTMYGNVLLFQKDKTIFLPRHGKNKNIPPHKVNHKANICAINFLGAEKIFSINSVGSLDEKIKPGSIILPDDYVDFDPLSFIEFELKFPIPEISEKLRKDIKAAAKKARLVIKPKAVYVQMKGPRFETRSEVKIIKRWGDIVGMTTAKEAALAGELNIPFAAVCSVDNYANGILKKTISLDDIEKVRKRTQKKLEKLIKELIR